MPVVWNKRYLKKLALVHAYNKLMIKCMAFSISIDIYKGFIFHIRWYCKTFRHFPNKIEKNNIFILFLCVVISTNFSVKSQSVTFFVKTIHVLLFSNHEFYVLIFLVFFQ